MNARMRARRFGVVAVAVLVLFSVAEVVSKAAVTFATANSSIAPYTLAAGATSGGITPPANTPVVMMGSNTTATNFSIASVNVVHVPSTQIRWVGLESPPSAAIVQGATSTPGTHVMYLDYNHQVDLEILSADQVVIHNAATTTQTGTVKLIW
jgi:hypothetical protein